MASTFSILQCPVCHGRLELSDDVKCQKCERCFPRTEGFPVLIDFEDSILKRENYLDLSEAATPRNSKGSGVGRFLRALTYGQNQETTQRNIDAFISEAYKLSAAPMILIIGGGTIGTGIEALYKARGIKIVGTDVYPSQNIEIICDGHKLPFESEIFDGVVIQAVLEHVLEPNRVIEEIHRVLKTNGLVYAETPFMQQVHERAYDFARFTFSGHRWLFRKFKEIDADLVLGPGIALLWSINRFVKFLGGSDKVATVITALFFWIRLMDRRINRGPALDAASGLYFFGSKSEEHLRANEMPDYYNRNR